MQPHHDPEGRRFVLPLGDEPATVSYYPTEDGVVVFHHVYVPASHRGTDASRTVLAYAFDHAREAGWRVRPTCPYIAGRYVSRHPELHDLIAE